MAEAWPNLLERSLSWRLPRPTPTRQAPRRRAVRRRVDARRGGPARSTKKELVARIAEKTNQTKVVAKDIIQMFLDEIIRELGRGNRLEFREFGVFEIKERAARKAQNPRTLEEGGRARQAGREVQSGTTHEGARVHSPRSKPLDTHEQAHLAARALCRRHRDVSPGHEAGCVDRALPPSCRITPRIGRPERSRPRHASSCSPR